MGYGDDDDLFAPLDPPKKPITRQTIKSQIVEFFSKPKQPTATLVSPAAEQIRAAREQQIDRLINPPEEKPLNYPVGLQDDPRAKAARLGLICIDADDMILQLDYDSTQAFIDGCRRVDTLRTAYQQLQERFFSEQLLITNSRQADHCHVYLALTRPMSIEMRIATQLYLNSNPTREMLALTLVRAGCPTNPVVLFESVKYARQYARWRETVPFMQYKPAAAPTELRIRYPEDDGPNWQPGRRRIVLPEGDS